MKIPKFISTQCIEIVVDSTFNPAAKTTTGTVSKLRMQSNVDNDYNIRMQLRCVDEKITMRSRQEDPSDVAVDILVEQGTKFEQAENVHNVIRSLNDIARITRRGAGNVILVHRQDHKELMKMIGHFMTEPRDIQVFVQDTPSLLGKIVTLYKGTKNDIDSAPIMGYDVEGRFGFSVDEIAKYVRVLPFKNTNYENPLSRLQKRQVTDRKSIICN